MLRREAWSLVVAVATGCTLFANADDLSSRPIANDAGDDAPAESSAPPAVDGGDKTVAVDAAPPDLVGEWLFDEAGGTIARDSSGRARDGRLTGTAKIGPGTFRGGALVLDRGGTLEIDALADAAFPPSGTLSLRMSSNLASGAAEGWNILDEWTTARQHIFVRHASARYQIALMYPADDYATFSFFDAPAGWVHLVVTWDTTQKLVGAYFDGKRVVDASFTRDFSPSQQRMSLGGGFDGFIDEIRLYDRAYSATEVAAMP